MARLRPAVRHLQEKRGSAMKWFSPMSLAIGLVLGLSVGLMLTPWIATENDVKVAMWLEVVQRVCTSVGGLGTFVALIIVIQQFTLLRTQSELVQKNKGLPQNLWVKNWGFAAGPRIFKAWLRCPTGGREGSAPDRLSRQGLMHRWRTVGLNIPCRVASPQSPTPFHQLLEFSE
jgi:hypothetical protein